MFDGADTPEILELNQHQLERRVAETLNSAYGQVKGGIGKLAELAGCNDATAKKWAEGKNCPGAYYLLRMIATCPELKAEVRRLTGMENDMDPMFARSFNDAMRFFQAAQRRDAAQPIMGNAD